jgi:DNA (cytosine-5)-methyltransferase 1
MKEGIDLLELFSGIGGFAKGIEQAGFTIKKHYFSEIDKHAIANYKYNFKEAEYVGSVVDVSRVKADIITFGSPCQDFSLAGNRAGMDGKRSVLILEAIRIISETRPSVFIWENVKGAFSSNDGADFWAIISAFANIGGYRLEWQLLNTSWFLPQNRERIYLIGHLAGRSEPGVFPITETDRRIAEGSTKAPIVRAITAGGHSGGHHSGMTLVKPVLTPDRKKKRQNGRRFKENGEPAFTLSTQDQHGVMITSEKTTIRRLTEIECERLQGFPDNWTKYGNYDGEIKEISKTQRYKMCGNAVTVDVVRAVSERLKIKMV